MIVAEQKDLKEILEMIAPYHEILVVGCNMCMAACSAGGQEEVEKLAKDLVAEREDLIVEKSTIPRQCSIKFINRLKDKVRDFKALLSMGCGNGVQMMAKQFPDKHVLPALNTRFIGAKDENGVWNETCMACGNCILWRTGGICPVTRCAKGLLNGPCGGSRDGMCEISMNVPCVWQEIYQSLKRLNLVHYLKEEVFQTKIRIHPRKIVKKDLQPQQLL